MCAKCLSFFLLQIFFFLLLTTQRKQLEREKIKKETVSTNWQTRIDVWPQGRQMLIYQWYRKLKGELVQKRAMLNLLHYRTEKNGHLSLGSEPLLVDQCAYLMRALTTFSGCIGALWSIYWPCIVEHKKEDKLSGFSLFLPIVVIWTSNNREKKRKKALLLLFLFVSTYMCFFRKLH